MAERIKHPLYEICFSLYSTPVETDMIIQKLEPFLRNYLLVEGSIYKRKISQVI